MGHGPEEHLEHAEHAQHAAHNPFDRKVTVTIAIVAAMLAAVTMVGHGAHNEALQLNIKKTDQYSFYQAKKNRETIFEASLDLVELLTLKDGAEKRKAEIVARWRSQNEKYEKELPEMLEKAKHLESEAAHVHHQAVFFDLGELALQLGVVLCSLAILTKGQGFWYSGMICSLIGFVVALSAYFGVV
jgi:hypothetical protein